MEDRLSEYDEKVLRRLIQIETANRAEEKKSPLAFVKRDTAAGASMRRLDQLGYVGAAYRDGNPLVVEVLGRGYSYIAMIDAEIADIERAERYRREDHQNDVFISCVTAGIGVIGVIFGFLLGHVL